MRRVLIALLLLVVVACAPPPGTNIPLPKDGNEPFEIDRGTEKGVLLLHGLSATPWEVRPLGEYLAARNVTVMAPLLAGHGTTEEDLDKVSWQDWYQSGNASLAQLRKKVRKVYVAGESTGADVAILLAKENDVDGIILMAPPIEFQDWRAQFAGVYQYLLPYADHSVVGPEIGHYNPHLPSHAVAELFSMVSRVKTVLPQVTTPVLVIQSINDQTIKPSSAEFVYQNIGSPDKELRLYGNASHVITQEVDAPDIIFYSVTDFIDQH